MIYLVGLSFWWVRDVLVPLALVGGPAGGIWLVLTLTVLRGRPRSTLGGFLVLLAAGLGWTVLGTRDVLFRFHNPQFAMFREHVADPIPAAVQDLAVDSAAPAMFFDGALLRFRAPAATRAAILAHALPGAATRQLAAALAGRLDRDPAVLGRIAGSGGGYLRCDPVAFAAYDTPEWTFVVDQWKGPRRDQLQPAPADRDVYVYAERGDWGTLACVATIAHGSDVMQLHVRPMVRARPR